MATGIVSIALQLHGWRIFAQILLWLACTAYAVLVILSGLRWWSFRDAHHADLNDPARSFGFFDFVAGTNVVGTGLMVHQHLHAAVCLLIVGSLSWLALGYVVPWMTALGHDTRPVVSTANGSWFIWVVAAQSVAVLASEIQPHSGAWRHELALFAVLAWSVGLILYAAVAVLVTIRLTAYEVLPQHLNPTYWVSMGATAITVVAGARMLPLDHAPAVASIQGLITGVSLVLWAFGTWLIPALVAVGWWRHVSHRQPLAYEPSWWGMVFPLGMYGVGSEYLGHAEHLPILVAIGTYEGYLAVAVWVVVVALAIRSMASATANRTMTTSTSADST